MRIAEGIEALELGMNLAGAPNVIHPTLLWDETDVVLVDTGVPGLLEAIRAEAARAGVDFDRLSAVILTHQDIDHIGSLPQVLAAAPGAVAVLAHPVERPYIEGEKPLVKYDPERMAKRFEAMPAEQRERMLALFANPPKAKITRTVAGGERLPWCGGISVIETPGHSPGHISLYHHPSRTLITGDALTASDGLLQGPNPQATPDLALAIRSLANLQPYDIETAICYHGGVCRGGIGARLAELAQVQPG